MGSDARDSSASNPGKRKAVTFWSLLALVFAVIGGGMTLLTDHFWLQSWAQSGTRYPVGRWIEIDLDPGSRVVFYESAISAPSDRVMLQMFDPDGKFFKPSPPSEGSDFELLRFGWSGRAIAQLNIETPGTYRLGCFNANYASNEEVPADDRIVMDKAPETLSEAMSIRQTIQITGGTLTFLLVGCCYLFHIIKLKRIAPIGINELEDES